MNTLQELSPNPVLRFLGKSVGYYGVILASLILSFYAIVAGWMLAYFLESMSTMFGWTQASEWLISDGIARNLLFAAIFFGLTMSIIGSGVEDGIEKWSTRLMPALIILLFLLIIYVLTQPGAIEGLKQYLLPDLSRITDPKLIISALGQAFFSLSLGVGTMLIYGSYLSKEESLPGMGVIVTLVDVGIAFTAGLLIIPAIFVAQHYGVEIYAENGELIAGPGLILQVLPALFDSMGLIGVFVSFTFFALMSIASLTSSISMLEVPVSTVVEKTKITRRKATLIIGFIVFFVSCMIIFNFATLFGFVIDLTTKYSEPLMGVALCVYAGWVLRRDQLLKALQDGEPDIENTFFWKIWPIYVKFFCPLLILITFYHSVS